jgi:hypothetical protein
MRFEIEFFRRDTGVCVRRPPRPERPRDDEREEDELDDERLERLLEDVLPRITISSNNIYDCILATALMRPPVAACCDVLI